MRRFLIGLWAALLGTATASAGESDFSELTAAARGQTVYFNAWGGSPSVNSYIDWVADELDGRFGIELIHVKLVDTADGVASIVAEKAAGRDSGGSVDLIWINGENFARMKEQELLFGPFVEHLPNASLIDYKTNRTALVDFAIATDGFEAPWGSARFVSGYDSDRMTEAPTNPEAFLDWAGAHPGQLTYPAPPHFIGTTFLKQMLYQLTDDEERLLQPVDDDEFVAASQALWDWLDNLHPNLWRQGRTFPQSDLAQHQLMNDGEVAITFAFNAGNIANLVDNGSLPPSTEIGGFDGGAIGNTHFLAIPYNANAPEAAMIAINFLLSAEAQARKQDPAYWGDPTVLDLEALDAGGREEFAAVPQHRLLSDDDPAGDILPDPHPSWHELLERRWLERYQR